MSRLTVMLGAAGLLLFGFAIILAGVLLFMHSFIGFAVYIAVLAAFLINGVRQ